MGAALKQSEKPSQHRMNTSQHIPFFRLFGQFFFQMKILDCEKGLVKGKLLGV